MIILRQRAFSIGQNIDRHLMMEDISNLLVSIQPKGWQKVILYANISKNSYEIFFYTKINGKYKKNFELERLGYGNNAREETKGKYHDRIFQSVNLSAELLYYTLLLCFGRTMRKV